MDSAHWPHFSGQTLTRTGAEAGGTALRTLSVQPYCTPKQCCEWFISDDALCCKNIKPNSEWLKPQGHLLSHVRSPGGAVCWQFSKVFKDLIHLPLCLPQLVILACQQGPLMVTRELPWPQASLPYPQVLLADFPSPPFGQNCITCLLLNQSLAT